MEYHSFAGKVKNANCSVTKLDLVYNQADCRCWSAIVNQGNENIIVTFNVNRSELGSKEFDILSSNRILTDVDPEDVCDIIEYMTQKPLFNQETEDAEIVEPLIEE
jgi:hypothetical protein